MQAKADFAATVNGAEYALKAGQEFEGDARAEAHLAALGLLGAAPKEGKKAAKAETKKEMTKDER